MIRTLFNEGWGFTGGPHPLQPDSIDFAEHLAELVRREHPGVLVNDNSACCENGHTEATDLNDVHNGLSGYLDWTEYLDPFSEKLKPGSDHNFDRGLQDGQPWMVSEFSLDRGHQPTTIGVFRSYQKMAGYASVQLADQENESASQLTYDRQDRGPVFLDHTGTPRGLDLINSDDAVSIRTEGTLTVERGARLTLPTRISHFSDHDLSSAQLRWKVAGWNAEGDWVDPGVGGTRPVQPPRYDVMDAGAVEVALPQSLSAGYVWVWVEANGRTVAENLVTFDDGAKRTGAFDPAVPVASVWTGGSGTDVLCGPQQITGYGAGYFEYTATVPAESRNGGTLLLEASAAEKPTHHDPSQVTKAHKFPTTLTVSVDGKAVKSVTLPDDPMDPLGTASRIHGVIENGYGNRYGYRVAVPLTATELGGEETVTVRLASNGGGLRVFGLHTGTSGEPPRILPGSKTVPAPPPVPTGLHRPAISLASAELVGGKGTAVVSVVNSTKVPLADTKVRLDLPPDWTVSSTGSTIGSLAPGAVAHVRFSVDAPADPDEVPATATATWTGGVVQTQAHQQVGAEAISEVAGGNGSLSGDGKAEFACVQSDGTIHAWHNSGPGDWLSQSQYDEAARSTTIGSDLADPARLRFADLDGDGRSEIINIRADGQVEAWRNAAGFRAMPWDGYAIIAKDFDPARTRFADLNADRKAEIITIHPDGRVEAWRNVGGFGPEPYSAGSVQLGTGFDAARTQFADFDGDRQAEILEVQPDGDVLAWRNAGGYDTNPYREWVVVATEMEPDRVRFTDLTGDGRTDVVKFENGGRVRGWHNTLGFAETPWRGASVSLRVNVTDPAALIFA